MHIIDVGEDRFIVRREVGQDEKNAEVVAKRLGGILVRNNTTGNFLICERILEAEYDEIEQSTPAETD